MFATLPALAADCTLALGANNPLNLSATGGLWTGTGCTGGSYIPAAPDTVVDITGTGTSRLTIDQAWDIGSSPGLAAIVFKWSAPVTQNAVVVTMRGQMQQNNATWTFSPGSTLQFDPAGTAQYSWRTAAGYQNNSYLIAPGTSGQHITINGGPAGGFMSSAGFTGGLRIVGAAGTTDPATYLDFVNCGTASVPCFNAGWAATVGVSDSYRMHNVTFTNSGGCCGSTMVGTNIKVELQNVVFAQTLSTNSLSVNAAAAIGASGLRRFARIVTDKPFTTIPWDFTVEDVATPSFTLAGGAQAWASVTRLLTLGTGMTPTGPISWSYLFRQSGDNPHWMQPAANFPASVTTSVFDQIMDYTTDSGENFNCISNSAAGTAYGYTRNVTTPSASGKSVSEMGSMLSTTTNDLHTYNHNVHVTTGDGVAGHRNGAIQYETGTAWAGAIASYRYNVIWGSTATPNYKLLSAGCVTITQDVGAPANLNYNVGWNITPTATCADATNQGKGYIGKFSVTPGANDIDDENPQMVDPYGRNLALWYTKYKNLMPASQWATSTPYSVGNIIWNTNANVYAGQRVAYECIVAHTSGASTEPAVGASWTTNWRVASWNSLANDIINGVTYTDASIDCLACQPIEAVTRWVQRGFLLQTPRLWVGPDGSFGAVEFEAKGRAMLGAIAWL
jgi:hypothetical protein